MSWLTPYLGPDPLTDELAGRTGALLIGNRTFHGDDPNRDTGNEGAFGGAWSGPVFVVTHDAPATPDPGVTFTDDLTSAVAAARAAAGDRYVNVLGADVARQCLEAGELDEILMSVAPVLLGAGTRMFDRPGGTTVALERTLVSEAPLATALWFRVLRDG
jgi:dihydrofolate reductase